MAYIDLGDDTNINVDLSSTTPINTELPDINYIPGYKEAEEERRANEVIRQENEQERIALYNDMEYKKETDYYRGRDGAIQYRAGTNIEITDDHVINCTGGSSETSWGDIAGTLANQTDLQNALDLKANASSIPTKTSDLNNDSGFITKDVNNLTNYTKTIDMQDHLTNTSSQVDTNYKVNVLTTKNLFDKDTMVLNAFINQSNLQLASSNDFRTIYIPCKPNTTYTIQKIQSNRFVWGFTSDDNLTIPKILSGVGGENTETQKTITSTNDAKYMFVMVSKITDDTTNINDLLNSIQIEEGSTATTYEAFIPNTINVDDNKFTDTINVGTDINSANRVNVIFNPNLFNKNDIEAGYLSNAGNVISNANFSSSNFIKLNGATKITIDNSTGQNENVCFYNSSKTFISYQATGTNTTMTIDVPNNAEYVRATIGNANINIYIIQEGSSIITPSINIDGEEIYNANLMNYSTNEQYIGTWFGQKLYRKGIYISGLPSSAGTKTFNVGSNIKDIVDVRGYVKALGSSLFLGYTRQTNTYAVSVYTFGSDITIEVGTDRSAYTGYAIVKYTKTTD